jgi:hypothetical protein
VGRQWSEGVSCVDVLEWGEWEWVSRRCIHAWHSDGVFSVGTLLLDLVSVRKSHGVVFA